MGTNQQLKTKLQSAESQLSSIKSDNTIQLNDLHASSQQNFKQNQDFTEEFNLTKLANINLKSEIKKRETDLESSIQKIKNISQEVETWKQKCHAYQEANNQMSFLVRDREEKLAKSVKNLSKMEKEIS